jgi:hypothetical protein
MKKRAVFLIAIIILISISIQIATALVDASYFDNQITLLKDNKDSMKSWATTESTRIDQAISQDLQTFTLTTSYEQAQQAYQTAKTSLSTTKFEDAISILYSTAQSEIVRYKQNYLSGFNQEKNKMDADQMYAATKTDMEKEKTTFTATLTNTETTYYDATKNLDKTPILPTTPEQQSQPEKVTQTPEPKATTTKIDYTQYIKPTNEFLEGLNKLRDAQDRLNKAYSAAGNTWTADVQAIDTEKIAIMDSIGIPAGPIALATIDQLITETQNQIQQQKPATPPCVENQIKCVPGYPQMRMQCTGGALKPLAPCMTSGSVCDETATTADKCVISKPTTMPQQWTDNQGQKINVDIRNMDWNQKENVWEYMYLDEKSNPVYMKFNRDGTNGRQVQQQEMQQKESPILTPFKNPPQTNPLTYIFIAVAILLALGVWKLKKKKKTADQVDQEIEKEATKIGKLKIIIDRKGEVITEIKKQTEEVADKKSKESAQLTLDMIEKHLSSKGSLPLEKVLEVEKTKEYLEGFKCDNITYILELKKEMTKNKRNINKENILLTMQEMRLSEIKGKIEYISEEFMKRNKTEKEIVEEITKLDREEYEQLNKIRHSVKKEGLTQENYEQLINDFFKENKVDKQLVLERIKQIKKTESI